MIKPRKSEVIKETVSNSSKPVNEKINISRVSKPKEEEPFYKCSCCGNEWNTQKRHFSRTKSPLYQANNGYITICNDCRDNYYYQLIPFFNGNEDLAIDRMCGLFDWYLNDNGLSLCKQTSDDRSRISHFLARKNCGQASVGDTYLDTVRERLLEENKTVESEEDLEEITEYKITPKMIKFWGPGYEPKALQTLQGYYDGLLKLCDGKPDVKDQKMMKNLCLLEYQMQINLQKGKDIGTLSNSYNSLFKASGLRANENDANSGIFGKWIMDIEKYAPAEYYKDKSKYHDFFGIVEYIERFMYRPLKNLIFGTKEKETEYWIDDDDIKTKEGG